ncbi:glycoside hydrolase family 108 protein [uncultured Tenacibaculum sp.]|uniref:glycoside hydrolase family 108 protein n=1 Tax=uncultured Tenacibaculum sp. TaxID=174713 RepID=UPI0026316D76|nr:glycosyl hydrolase 108 family protein [uncultured Tenacibaculum sp.]
MANFNLFTQTISAFEGGFQKRKSDPGNYNSERVLVGTNHGISASFYQTKIGRPPTEEDMRAITKEMAKAFFKTDFWDKVNADLIHSQAVAENIVDHAINAGPGTIGRIVQKVLNKYFGKSLAVDGAIGLKSIQAINSVSSEKLFQKISQYRLIDYKTKNNPSWLKIWIKRVNDLADKFGISIEKKKYLLHWLC